MVFLARFFAVLFSLWTLLTLFLGGDAKSDYSQVSQYISELNATGSAQAELIGFWGFVPIAVLFGLFWLCAYGKVPLQGASRLGYWLLLSQPIAYLMAVGYPCDLGCPANGSPDQQMHNLFGLVTYLAGILAFFLLASAPALRQRIAIRQLFLVAGVVWLLGLVFFSIGELEPWRGLIQRIMELLLHACVWALAFSLASRRSRSLSLFHQG